jgi:Rhodopirellula transposase DDE domain
MCTTFPSQAQVRVILYGIDDLHPDIVMANVGVTRNTAEFGVESITKWCRTIVRFCYRQSKGLLICADSGDSNRKGTRLWKVALQ